MSDFPGDISFWLRDEDLRPRTTLQQDIDVDVAIVGGGYTGLWTAWYLRQLAPELSVCVLEAQVCGFGASGRNGGWLMGSLEGQGKLLAGLSEAERAPVRSAIVGILPAVEAALAAADIDCDYQRGGGLFAAGRYPAQRALQEDELAYFHALGYGDEDYRWLSAAEMSSRVGLADCEGGIYTPHIARVQPGKLVRQLARAVVDSGAQIYEHTPVQALCDDGVQTLGARVRARYRVLAQEGYSGSLLGRRRRILPVASRIVVTEPLSAVQWQSLGLQEYEVFSEASPVISYAQRTADNRLVFGSRGNYFFGARAPLDFSADSTAFEAVRRLMVACFPALANTPISHRWGGCLGVPRAFVPHAVCDHQTGLATAGGYLGEGVGASNLMARTLVDILLQRDTELTRMPWAHCGHPRSQLRAWEPEPLRWLGYKATDLSLRWQEAAYSRNVKPWHQGLAKGVSDALGRLRS